MFSIAAQKAAGGVIMAMIALYSISFLAEGLMHVGPADTIGPVGGAAEEVVEEAPKSLAQLLAEATVKQGERVAKKCISCHTFEAGGANKVGPALYGVIGKPKARLADFNYSEPMRESPGVWSYQSLYDYLAKPSAYVPGTSMTFAGLNKSEDRAALLKYMASEHDDPPPFPAVAVAEDVPAEGVELLEPEVMEPEIMPEDAQP